MILKQRKRRVTGASPGNAGQPVTTPATQIKKSEDKKMQADIWKITTKPAFQGMGKWVTGETDFDGGDEKITFQIKVFETPSHHGINGNGRISKLEIRLGNEVLAQYDRGWGVEPSDEVMPIYEGILENYN